MKTLDVIEMAELTGGAKVNWWCVSSGILTGFALATGPLGWAMWGPPALATGIVCAHG